MVIVTVIDLSGTSFLLLTFTITLSTIKIKLEDLGWHIDTNNMHVPTYMSKNDKFTANFRKNCANPYYVMMWVNIRTTSFLEKYIT